jgi:hypothetical protein
MSRWAVLGAALAVAAAIVASGTTFRLAAPRHDELLVTYSLSARSFTARALEASDLFELRVPLAELPVAMPSVVPAEGGMLHASASASYFLRAWSALSAAASALGDRFPIAA